MDEDDAGWKSGWARRPAYSPPGARTLLALIKGLDVSDPDRPILSDIFDKLSPDELRTLNKHLVVPKGKGRKSLEDKGILTQGMLSEFFDRAIRGAPAHALKFEIARRRDEELRRTTGRGVSSVDALAKEIERKSMRIPRLVKRAKITRD